MVTKMIALNKTVYSLPDAQEIQKQRNWTDEEYEDFFEREFHFYESIGIEIPGQWSSLLYIKLNVEDIAHIDLLKKENEYDYAGVLEDICCMIEILKKDIEVNGIIDVYNNSREKTTLFSRKGISKFLSMLPKPTKIKEYFSSAAISICANMDGTPSFLNQQGEKIQGKSFLENLKTTKHIEESPSAINQAIKLIPHDLSEACINNFGNLLKTAYRIKEALIFGDYRYASFTMLRFNQKFATHYIANFSDEIKSQAKADEIQRSKENQRKRYDLNDYRDFHLGQWLDSRIEKLKNDSEFINKHKTVEKAAREQAFREVQALYVDVYKQKHMNNARCQDKINFYLKNKYTSQFIKNPIPEDFYQTFPESMFRK
jgi:hypothetical protein